jgi:hypothetical protein
VSGSSGSNASFGISQTSFLILLSCCEVSVIGISVILFLNAVDLDAADLGGVSSSAFDLNIVNSSGLN